MILSNKKPIQGVPKKRTFRIIILLADTSEKFPTLSCHWRVDLRSRASSGQKLDDSESSFFLGHPVDIWMLCLSWYLQNLDAGFWFFSEFLLARNSWHIYEFGIQSKIEGESASLPFLQPPNQQSPSLPIFATTKKQSPSLSISVTTKKNNFALFHLELENVADKCQALMRSSSFSKKTSHWRW